MRERSVARHGIVAGVLSATSVAAWFLLTDTLSGRPFFVPAGLGRNFLQLFGVEPSQDMIAPIIAYTIFHYAVFIAVGILASAVAKRSRRDASVLAGAFLFFMVVEGAFFGFAAFIAATTVIGAGAWIQIGIANLIAVVVMGVYLWRAYPHVLHQLHVALSGRE
jgi:glycopeptide antibiotics resistance protein